MLARPWALARRKAWYLVFGVLIFVFAPLLTVSRLEESDPFCTSCHTVPEVAYFNRTRAALSGEVPVDLASAHYSLTAQDHLFRCIDCHRGDGGLAHRAVTLALGARDALIFVAGRADPSIERVTLEVPVMVNAGCVKCHADSLLVVGFGNHYHNKLPAAYAVWKEGGKLAAPPDAPEADTTALEEYETSVQCLDCHRAHIHNDLAELSQYHDPYLDIENIVYPGCVKCHQEVGHGPLELVTP